MVREDFVDNRLLVQDLLAEHTEKLAQLRNILEKEETYSKERYDDLWMLRFLLSHKLKVSKASAAAIRTMKFRQERKLNELGDVRHKLMDHLEENKTDRNFDIHKKYMSNCHSPLAIIYAIPDPDRGIVQRIDPALIDTQKSVETMSFDETIDAYLLVNEIMYQILDDTTRRTGKLTQVLRIMELGDFTMKMLNLKYMKRDAAANKAIEDYYPCLLGKCINNNPPAAAVAAWKIIQPLFPKRFVQKLAFCAPTKHAADAQHFLEYIARENLWERYGGTNTEWPPKPATFLWEKWVWWNHCSVWYNYKFKNATMNDDVCGLDFGSFIEEGNSH